eukprot:TRINITY_DN1511_c0_g1_i1.p2 TRINITY_DN1511_c0_g1~~TRINITY_DN1511_c0_g1_i1.p2  ORF type:complete len:239 (-),score=55.91 TRINITY_DN1511_c0_g1_i1:51-767(-)
MFPESVEGFADFGEEYEKQAFVYFLVGIIIPFFVERILVTHSHSHSGFFKDDDEEAPARSTIGVYLLMLMLSIHSFIEGIALGVQNNAAGTSTVLWAIVAHKFFAAFALGVSLVKGNVPVRQLIQIIVFFSLTTPVGAGLGLGLSSVLGNLQSLAAESVKAIASGTFVYVALMEVLAEEFGHPNGHDGHVDVPKSTQIKKFLLVITGIVAMGLASMYAEHEHGGHGAPEVIPEPEPLA